jgi:hypothetical protein
VAEAAGVKVSLISGSDCLVSFQSSRLHQAIVHLLQFGLASAAPGAEVRISADEQDEVVRVTVAVSPSCGSRSKALPAGNTAASAERKQHEMKRRLGVAIARRILGGESSLRTEDSGERLWLDVRLPSVSVSK